MATPETIEAMLNAFALQWRFDFDPESALWPKLVEQWEGRLRLYDDDTVIQATERALDELKAAPKIADIRERCQALKPSESGRLEYLDDLPRRNPVEAAAAQEFNATLRQRYAAEIAAAAKRWGKLLDEVRDARAAKDDERLTKAMRAVEEARSPAAYRRWQAYWMDKAEPGSSASLPPLEVKCETCNGQGYVLVSYKQVRGLPYHWTPVPKSPNAPSNSAGVLYYCPTCVTASVAEKRERAA